MAFIAVQPFRFMTTEQEQTVKLVNLYSLSIYEVV